MIRRALKAVLKARKIIYGGNHSLKEYVNISGLKKNHIERNKLSVKKKWHHASEMRAKKKEKIIV